MKSSKFFLAFLFLGLAITSCKNEDDFKTTVVDFEDVALNSDSIWNGSDNSGSFTSLNGKFINQFDSSSYNGATFYFWSGFACSAKTDQKTPGFVNQYSTIAGKGAADSKQFALAYNSASFTCKPNVNGNFSIKSIMLTNSTYTYLDMKNGTPYVSKVFETGDWFKVVFAGYLNKVSTGEVEYYLADLRDGKNFMANTWNKVDMSALGKVDSVAISFNSSDIGQFGINTPTYVCIDNIEFTQTISTK